MATITDENFGAWLIRCNPKEKWDLPGFIAEGGTHIDSWSVAKNYRSDRMAPGDPIILWVAGDSKLLTRGVWGLGYVTGATHDFVPDDYDPQDIGYWIDEKARKSVQNIVDVDIPLFKTPVSDAEIQAAGINDLEVHRAPQMSNPSWVSKDELVRLQPLLPPWPGHDEGDEEITVSPRGAGFGKAAQNSLVEAAAMLAVEEYYEGWDAVDVSLDKVGWDITFTHTPSDSVARVEVKGLSGDNPVVLLTANEIKAAEDEPDWSLAVVTRALSDPTVTEYTTDQALGRAKPYVFRADLRGVDH